MNVEELERYGIPLQIIRILKERGIHKLYKYQEKAILDGILNLKDSFIISVPTAGGKTLLAELAAIKYLIENNDKIVLYISPLKSLAKEKYETFKVYERFGIRVAISTGDYDSRDEWLGNYNIIITTIEKADSLLRHEASWLKRLGLVIIDEIHIINDKDRGPTLEILIMKLKEMYKPIIIALSATIPNDYELASWLSAKLIRDNFRPVPLKEGVLYNYRIYFVDEEKPLRKIFNDELFDATIDTILSGGQCLIFVNSRNQAENLAEKLSGIIRKYLKIDEKYKLLELSNKILNILEEPTDTCKKLASCVRGGVAFHHAGLLSKHREIIEEYFRNRVLKVIVATPTLASGVNLPARRVIVRDVIRYNKGRIEYLPVFEVKQMFGRCLTSDCLIKTNFGDLSVKEIINNFKDIKFLSFNFLKNKFEYVKPICYTKRETNKLIFIETKSTSISLTEEHPILCYNNGLIWKYSKDIKIGDRIVTYNKNCLKYDEVLNIKVINSKDYVYDFVLTRNHNFVANDIIVHNSGRPGYDEYGESILIAKSKNGMKELFKRYILSEPEKVFSKLSMERNLRFHILGLISSGIVKDEESLINFLKKSFYYFQSKRIDFEERVKDIIEFLIENDLIENDERFRVTNFGKRVVELYIDPETAVLFKNSLSMNKRNKEIFYIYTISKAYEMPKIPVKTSDIEFLEEFMENFGEDLYVENEDYEEILEYVKISSMIYDWINEKRENYILNKYGIAPGDFRARIEIAEWLCYCLKEISKILKNNDEKFLERLLYRIKFGVKEELLELIKIEGVGRVRARTLYKFGIRNPEDILNIGVEKLKRILGEKLGEKIYKNTLELINKMKT